MTVKALEGTVNCSTGGSGGLRNSIMVEKTKPVWESVMSTGYHSSGPLRDWEPPTASLASEVLLHGKHNHTIRERTGLDLEDLESWITLL